MALTISIGQAMNKIWYINPAKVIILVHLPLLLLAFALPSDWYARHLETEKGINLYSILDSGIHIALFLIFYIAAYRNIFHKRQPTRTTINAYLNLKNIHIITYTILGFYITANIVLLIQFIQNPSYFLLLASSDVEQGYGRTLATTIPGLTTLTQLGILLSVFAASIIAFECNKTKAKKGWVILFIIIIFSVLRAFTRGERLALLEVLIPFFVIIASYRINSKLFLKYAPLFAITFLLFVFGLFEYFRSWTHYYSNSQDDYIYFVLSRISSYFIGAINTGAYLVDHGYNNEHAWMTMRWLYSFPGLSKLNEIYDKSYFEFMSLLRIKLNAEFNNISPVYALILDFGRIASWVVISILGAITGYLYKRFYQRDIAGILLYPIWFIGILEFSRTFSWGSSRFFPPIIAGIIIAAWFKQRNTHLH